ncbi:MAG: type I polyketide synthase, partial [Bacteroidota bacterium]
AFFKYQAFEAAIMDPQVRVFHEVVWTALEDAGVVPHKNNRIGLYAGASDNSVWKSYHTFVHNSLMVQGFMAKLLCDKDRLSTLISYKLGLHGPSLFVRTACSTALVGVHLACRALLTGECSIAVAGGVSISSHALPGYYHANDMIYSSDGHTKTFDAESDGTMFCNGAGAIVLKKLAHAERDKDHIYGIIKGSAINNDGAEKIGYTAPSVEGQHHCIKQAQKVSKVGIDSIKYVEAHGTATNLGDPIEIKALNLAFADYGQEICHIGSIKSNVGHLGAAAGVAGLIKTVLALQTRQLPPTVHFSTPNNNIPFADGPFQVVDELSTLEPLAGHPLRAGVSSFGIGGTNAHVVLEEPPQRVDKPDNNRLLLFPFSAQQGSSLRHYLRSFSEYLSQTDHNLSDIAYTLQNGRKAFDYRLCLSARSKTQLLEGIAQKMPGIAHLERCGNTQRKIVFMFPGQGVQYFRMGHSLYQEVPAFRAEMDLGFARLSKLMPIDFKSLLFDEQEREHLLHDTKYTQPILFTIQYALSRALDKLGIKPQYLIGHSFGEYTAACLSGVLTVEDALKILIKRGALMEKLPEGRMLAVSAGAEQINPYLKAGVSIASINSPYQCILSGEIAAIESLMEQFEAEDIKHRLLNVSFASHSTLIDHVKEEYLDFLRAFTFREARIPFISNISGQLIVGEEGRTPEYWCEHLRNTVDFSKGIQTLDHEDNLVFVEIGPGDTLSRLFKQNKRKDSSNIAIGLVRNGFEEMTSEEEHAYFFSGMGDLWANNVMSDWSTMGRPAEGRKIPLPTYAFQRTKFPAFIDLKSLLAGQEVAQQIVGVSQLDQFFEEQDEFDAASFTDQSLLEDLRFIWKKFFGVDEL